MALKRPGTQSNTLFAIGMFWAIVMVTVLVAGHIVLLFLIYSGLTDGKGMEEIAKFTSLPAWALWLSVVGGLALDAWIAYHHFKERREALRR